MPYPALFLRIKAMLLDSVLAGLLFLGTVYVASQFEIPSNIVKAIIVFSPVVLFEPMMIWITGGSLGHHYAGIRVVGKNSNKNLFVLNGIARLFVKTLLGFFSLVTMLITRQQRSLHDVIAHSVVVFKDESVVPENHKLRARKMVYSEAKPSMLRRFIVVLAYCVLLYMILGVVLSLTQSTACFDNAVCTENELMILVASVVVGLVLMLAAIVLGFMCKLPGAYFRKEKSDTQNTAR